MSTVSESITRRMTLGYVAQRYGFDLVPPFASGVTVTSLADDVESVRPGALFMPLHPVDPAVVEQARCRGAYAALLPLAMREQVDEAALPVLFADPDAHQVGVLACDIAGSPADTLAVFAICGSNAPDVAASVKSLAGFLHMLGNPVGVITVGDSSSLDRYVELSYPLNVLDMQRMLAVCAEDGAAAVVIAVNEETLAPDALQAVNVDVLGFDVLSGVVDSHDMTRRVCDMYGCPQESLAHVVCRTDESDVMAAQATFVYDQANVRRLSLAIAMSMAAGVRRNNIKSALRVSHDMR